MLWTEEATAILKRLAHEGKSASAIAEALGLASRNAVIGKANRIGVRLNGGGRAGPALAGARPAAAAPRAGSAVGRARERTTKPAFAEVAPGEMRRVKLNEIRQSVCRWPLGDPASGDFAYCGLTSTRGRPYCAHHCRIAYRAPAARRGPQGVSLSWSPSRYAEAAP